tara:strand:- start:207 stop:407 length:201 start_codon:yes stop_codon:yes gene_type:complete
MKVEQIEEVEVEMSWSYQAKLMTVLLESGGKKERDVVCTEIIRMGKALDSMREMFDDLTKTIDEVI